MGTLSTAMSLRDPSQHGIALGAWGAVFATAEGSSFALSGVLKDWLSHLVANGTLSGALERAVRPVLGGLSSRNSRPLHDARCPWPAGAAPQGQVPAEELVARPFGLADIPA